MKKLKLNVPNCCGCRLCELACSFAHFDVFSHDIPNIHVSAVEDTCEFTPYVCVQCDQRACIGVCPVDALSVSPETGAINADRDACILCGLCIAACEKKGIRIIKYDGIERLAICDLCSGGEPRCAAACREDAVVFV